MNRKMAMGWIPDYPGWGESGYGWLPYECANKGLAEDFWSVLKKEWVDTGEFRI